MEITVAEDKMITGEDWSKIEVSKTDEKDNIIETNNYFPRYFSLFGTKISPFNLGIYQTPSKEGDILRSTQYIGVLPLLPIGSDTEKQNQIHIKILPRFHISPIEMLNEVLLGDDYNDNPKMLKTHSYSLTEWKNVSQDKKILFGILNGAGKIDLSPKNDGQKLSEYDVEMVNLFGAFEIIDFVNKAKMVCSRNLKKQSQRVEENLYCKVKGRILINKQIKYNASKGQNCKMYCSFNRMSENIKENQILKYALHLCQKKHGIADSLLDDINFCLRTLSGVPLTKVSQSDFIGLKNNGAYRQYKDALLAAQKIISRYGITYSSKQSKETTVKNYRISPYFIDMNLLFEFYCRAIFKKAIDEYNKSESNIHFQLESALKAKKPLFKEKSELESFYMKEYIPDIVIKCMYKGNNTMKVAAVFDAKYSDVEEQTISQRARTHQILFYMKTLGCDYGGLVSPYKKNQNIGVSSDNILINGLENNITKLFYIPFEKEGSTDMYVERAVKVLEDIAKNIEKKREIWQKIIANAKNEKVDNK